ncbi:hypothetical protein A3848_11505 [Paenibacillus sp. P32E]|nr:hypothetical protein A3848_11505 [Paenibacillus sp. P32E]
MWKSGSGRLGLRIFTAKGNGKIWRAQRLEQRSVRAASTQAKTYILLQNQGASQEAIHGFWDAPVFLHDERCI